MKVPALLFLCLMPVTAFAFDPTPRRVVTIGVLEVPAQMNAPAESALARGLASRLSAELRKKGFDASPTGTDLEEESRTPEPRYDALVEVTFAAMDNDALGGVSVGGHDGGADVSVVRSQAVAAIRIYDGVTLEEIDSPSVQAQRTGIAPTAIGLGDRHWGIWVGLPIARYTRQRALAQALAEEAATAVVVAVNAEAAK